MKTSITSEVLVKQGLTNRLSESSNEKRKKDFWIKDIKNGKNHETTIKCINICVLMYNTWTNSQSKLHTGCSLEMGTSNMPYYDGRLTRKIRGLALIASD